MDWVIQYDPPRSIREFVRRRGRIPGRSVAFVLSAESGFVDELKGHSSDSDTLQEFDFPPKKLLNVQPQIEKLVSKSFAAHQLAKEAFRLVSPFTHIYIHTRDEKLWSVLLIAA